MGRLDRIEMLVLDTPLASGLSLLAEEPEARCGKALTQHLFER